MSAFKTALEVAMAAHNSVCCESITYNGSSILGTPLIEPARYLDGNGAIIEGQAVSFQILRTELDKVSSGHIPKEGDVIVYNSKTYRVANDNIGEGMPPWGFTDTSESMLQVHAVEY